MSDNTARTIEALGSPLAKVILGKDDVIHNLLIALLSGATS